MEEETAGGDERMEGGGKGRETVCQQVLKKSGKNLKLTVVECN